MKLYSQSVSENSFFLRLDLNFLHFLDFCRRRLLISDSNQVHFRILRNSLFFPFPFYIFFFRGKRNIPFRFSMYLNTVIHIREISKKMALNMSHPDKNHFSFFFLSISTKMNFLLHVFIYIFFFLLNLFLFGFLYVFPK